MEIKINCKDCGKEFVLTESEQTWFNNMGYEFPKRCKECREKAKKYKDAKECFFTDLKEKNQCRPHPSYVQPSYTQPSYAYEDESESKLLITRINKEQWNEYDDSEKTEYINGIKAVYGGVTRKSISDMIGIAYSTFCKVCSDLGIEFNAINKIDNERFISDLEIDQQPIKKAVEHKPIDKEKFLADLNAAKAAAAASKAKDAEEEIQFSSISAVLNSVDDFSAFVKKYGINGKIKITIERL